MAVAQVHVRSWQAAYRGLLAQAYLDGLRAEDRAARYDFTHTDPAKPFTLVADLDGFIAGFATTMPARDVDLPGWGELVALYVDPDFWGRGYGVELIAAARAHFLEQGFGEAALWVLKGNVRAENFYGKDGWQPDGSVRTVTVWEIAVNELRYRRKL
jgi:GNAT superfamily N-acetyltransferase